MAQVIGIDLGTTFTVAAYLENGRPEVIPNAEGGRLTPSVVAMTLDGKRWVGQVAKRQAIANPHGTISSIKRRMGSDYTVKMDGKEYTPQEISALILRKVKTDAESYLGEKVEKAVITVPAYFNDSQRQATKDAGTIAGLDVIRIINEPTAAALAYGLHREDIHTVLVWDLGGGTFDVSILDLGKGVFEVKAVNGNTCLGGDDWDQRIMDDIADAFQKEQGIDLRGDPMSLQWLKEAAEQAKIELSTQCTTTIELPSFLTDTHRGIPLTRARFEELTQGLMQKMVAPTRQALADAKLTPEKIDRVILVGGATRMPAVQECVKRLLGKEPYREINPDEVVAMGAAIQAGILMGEVREVVLIDVIPLSLGIETQGGVSTKMVERNTVIPTSRGQIFTTARDHQTCVDIHVLQGERALARDNMSLGRFQLHEIPPQPRGIPQIEVTFEIDANGILHVSAVDLHTENEKKVAITSSARLSKEEVERMIEKAQIHAEEDKRRLKDLQIAIRAESMISAAQMALEEWRGKGDTSYRDQIEEGVLRVKTALACGESEKIKSSTEELTRLVRKLYSKKEIKYEESEVL